MKAAKAMRKALVKLIHKGGGLDLLLEQLAKYIHELYIEDINAGRGGDYLIRMHDDLQHALNNYRARYDWLIEYRWTRSGTDATDIDIIKAESKEEAIHEANKMLRARGYDSFRVTKVMKRLQFGTVESAQDSD